MTHRKCQAHPSDFLGLSSSYVYFYEILILDRNFKPCYNPIHEEIIQYADYSLGGLNNDSITFAEGSVFDSITQNIYMNIF